MKNKSIWLEGIKKEYLPSLDKNIETDILIIGGGISGLTTAYFLKNSKYKVTLIEKDSCGYGVSANTTGKLTFLQELIYHKLESNYNNEIALKYLNSQKDAIKIVKNIITKNNIDCNLNSTSSYVFTNNIDNLNTFKKEESFFNKNNIVFKTTNKIPINFPCQYAIKVSGTYVIHPLKYLLAIKKILLENGIEIYENTTALNLEKEDNQYIINTNNNRIKTKIVIVTTHYPFFVNPYFLPFKSNIENSYIIASNYHKVKNFTAISSSKPTHSIRFHQNNDKNYLIYAGISHSISNHFDIEMRYKELIKDYKQNFGNDIKYYFLNHDVMTYDSLPYIGKINDNLYLATGYNKWGMTNGTIAGKVISDLIFKKNNPYSELFNPYRKISKDKIKNMIVYNYLNGKAYILNKLINFNNDKVIIKDKIGTYIDKKGIEHKVSIICPHLKCHLIFNNVDKTWDCPCHGSRFDIDGNSIFGPSVYSIKLEK